MKGNAPMNELGRTAVSYGKWTDGSSIFKYLLLGRSCKILLQFIRMLLIVVCSVFETLKTRPRTLRWALLGDSGGCLLLRNVFSQCFFAVFLFLFGFFLAS